MAREMEYHIAHYLLLVLSQPFMPMSLGHLPWDEAKPLNPPGQGLRDDLSPLAALAW